jgi:predicted permease
MSFWRQLIRGVRVLGNRRAADQEIADEVSHYVEESESALIAKGLSPEEARRAARLELGSATAIREQVRSYGWENTMGGILADFKFALRTLRRSPLFTLIAVLSLALGIGANTAIFSLMDQLLLRLLPVKDPESLVMLSQRGTNMGGNDGERANSYPIYQDYQRRADAFSEVFCQKMSEGVALTVDNETELVSAEVVSGNYFTALGVKPAIGRVFNSAEDDQVYKGHPVVALSYDYWMTRFSGDRNVVGKKVLVNNHPMTIVGVSAAGFSGVDPARSPKIRVPILMLPMVNPGWESTLGARRLQWVRLFARLKPGYTVESAQASLQVLFTQIRQYEATLPEAKDWSARSRERFLKATVVVEKAATGYSQLRNSFSKALVVLMCMVGIVLLIACANVASLLIARAVARQKEIAVRLSIGASQGQLVRQLLVESLVLAVAGGTLGILLAVWITKGLLSLLPTGNAVLMLSANPNARILLFNIGLTLLTGLIFGIAPAFRATRLDLWSTLKDAVGSVAGTSGAVRVRKVLVTAQVALSFLLLFGAGLFVQSLQNLRDTKSGFENIEHLLSFRVDPSLNGYDLQRAKRFHQELLERIRALPGVQSGGYARAAVLAGSAWGDGMLVEGHAAKEGENTHAQVNFVSPGYFRTMGVPLLEGRDFDERDVSETRRVCLVNRTFAEHYFPGSSAVGRHIGSAILRNGKVDVEIVGVAENALYNGPREGSRRQVFFAEPQERYLSGKTFYVRTNLDSKQMFGAINNAVKKLDPRVAASEVRTLDSQLDHILLTERLIAMMSAGFGALATLLASIGLYGVMAFVVARRTKEIGVRLALGAMRGSVVWLVMREVLLLLGLGLAVGIPAALALGRFISAQLYGVKENDPWVAGIAVILLSFIAAMAGWVPARRASRIDPLHALRYD